MKYLKECQYVESEEEEEEMELEDGEGEVEFTDLHSVLLTAEDEDAQAGLCVLPPHHRCAAHTLTSRSTVASDCLEEVGEKKLIVPTVKRWNSFYDAYA